MRDTIEEMKRHQTFWRCTFYWVAAGADRPATWQKKINKQMQQINVKSKHKKQMQQMQQTNKQTNKQMQQTNKQTSKCKKQTNTTNKYSKQM